MLLYLVLCSNWKKAKVVVGSCKKDSNQKSLILRFESLEKRNSMMFAKALVEKRIPVN